MDLFGLKGRVAVVTGASSGLGADAARAYAAYGADVALVARRKERLESLAEELRGKGVKALPVACDVSREDDVRAAVERIMDYFGRVDILLNDAGVAVPGGVETLTAEEWDRSMDINVRGMFLMCKYVVPHMRERRYGKIVNISSVNATLADKVPELWRHAYNASKAAVKGLTVGMAAFLCSGQHHGEFHRTGTVRERNDGEYALQARSVHADVRYADARIETRCERGVERYHPLFLLAGFELCDRTAYHRGRRFFHRMTKVFFKIYPPVQGGRAGRLSFR